MVPGPMGESRIHMDTCIDNADTGDNRGGVARACLHPDGDVPVFAVPVYVVFSAVWMLGSSLLYPPVDDGMAPNTVWLFFAGLMMGLFSGAFTGAAAFASMATAPSEPGLSLGAYLKCADASVLDRFFGDFSLK